MAEQVMITTTDNPFNPFDQYEEWLTWDMNHGYNTIGLLARVVVTSDELSDEDQAIALLRGIDEIVDYNVSGVHAKVIRFVTDPEEED